MTPAGPSGEPPPGTVARDALEITVARTAVVFRGSWSVVVPLLAYPQALSAGSLSSWQHVAVISALAWGGLFCFVAGKGRLPRWAVLVDAATFGVYLLLSAQVLPAYYVGDNTTWVSGGASVSVFIVSWALRPAGTILVATAEAGAFLGGTLLAGKPLGPSQYTQAGVFVLQGVLAVVVIGLIARHARRADATLDQVERARAELAVERSRMHSRRQFERDLHDTVLSTLTVVARGTLAQRQDLVRARCGRDLELLDQLDRPPEPASGLFAGIAWEAGCRAVSVRLTLPPEEPELPPDVVEAVTGAVRETLSNVERHAGVPSAELVAGFSAGRLTVVVRDQGGGFDPEAKLPGHTGVQRSVVERMAAIGGTATIDSTPGAGTEVTLRWDGSAECRPPDGGTGPAGVVMVAETYRNGASWAFVLIALVWHLFCFSQLVSLRAEYRPLWLEIAAWLVVVVVVGVVAVHGPDRPLPAAASVAAQLSLLAAAAAAVYAVRDSHDAVWANWVLGDIGWPMALVAVHRPLRHFLAWTAGVVVIVVGGVLAGPHPQVADVVKAVSNLLCALVLQVGTVIAAGMVQRIGMLAEAGTVEGGRIRIARESLAAVARDRERWQRELGASLRPLVRGLAAGSLGPGDSEVRGRCAIEASRLRAMLSELTDAGEHSVWRRDLVAGLSRAAADRSATLAARVAPDFGEVPEPVRAELVAVVHAVLRLTRPGEIVVTLSGDASDASATVLMPVGGDRTAVRAVRTLLEKVEEAGAGSPGSISADVEEPGSSSLWMEVRWVS